MVRKRQLTMEEGQTIITLKNVGLSYREVARKVKMSVRTVSFTIKRHSETGEKLAERGLADPKLLKGHQRLQAARLTGPIAARKPLLRFQNKTKRLGWTMKHCHWTTEDWKNDSSCLRDPGRW
uniref:Transposase IS30-like HTH domain-containing protein n=1 Tax=Pundamilia nyererei TaxID=303518 RepID=A0A3B4GNZ6_9CICH